ncbi:MAG: hypothetical protein LBM04_12835 [Opitutaceae bacterium]|jgi:5S rRNA maturation endonuclease (ribonuclease M5)|nr:hypothetical protein [Opitutaceae bacterium]
MSKPRHRDFPRILIVEGYSDLAVYAELLDYLGKNTPQRVHIEMLGGRSTLETSLETFINPGLLAEKTHIGVIVDADADGQRAANRIAATLRRLTDQQVRENAWTPATTAKPRIGLLVVPEPAAPGELEDILWNAWADAPANTHAKQCVESFVECMAQKSSLRARSPVKGRLGALLAILNDDDPRPGPAAKARCFDFAQPHYKRIVDFLNGF